MARAREQDLLRRRVWTIEATSALRDRARSEGATVFGAIVAACLHALQQDGILAGGSVEFRAPLDLRSRCRPPIPADAVGCYATMMSLALTAVDEQPFWDLARQTRREVERQLESGLWAASWHLLRWLLHRGTRLPVPRTVCGVSNLGTIETPACPALKILEMSWTVNQRGVSNNVRLSCATVNGVLNLTLRSPQHSPAKVEQLLDDILLRLEAAIDSHAADSDSAVVIGCGQRWKD